MANGARSAAPVAALRGAVRAALAGLAGGPLREGATALFAALGYESDRTPGFGGAGAVVKWLAEEIGDKPLTDRQRESLAGWRDAELLFQITDDEIDRRQFALLDGARFDAGRQKSFLFAAVDLAGESHARARLAEAVRAVNARLMMPAVLLFRHGGTVTLGVAHRRPDRRDGDRDVLEKVTLVKDIRCADPRRAHLDILADLALPRLVDNEGARDFDSLHAAWERTLDIEALNRRFYGELFAWFERAVAEARFPDDGAGPGSAERHVIRLITRLLFIWFLTEKRLVPRRLFTEDFARETLAAYDPAGSDYYRAVLQNLFFATLNTEIAERAFSTAKRGSHRVFGLYRYSGLLKDPDGFVERLRRVPFVNGGLFECLDGEGGRRVDAFTDNPKQGRDLDAPARLFFDERGLFPLFRRYKFTVEENTPLDREAALDPELLGRVFENLLAAYNPETRRTARKATGSYYTPRHVVDYMAGEALAAALAEKAPPPDGDVDFRRERLRYLLDYERACDDAAELFDPAETESLVRAIARLRVLDPAVGSGAFPMGALHKLTLALRRLDPDNRLWERIQKELAAGKAGAAFDAPDREAREEELRDISRIFEAYRDSDYGRKLYLIQNGLFGVDIQPVACQIAKLRVFVSLAIEQEANDDAGDNYGIRPLPNLETRFVAADALIGLDGPAAQGVLGDGAVTALQNRLRAVRERHFNARTRRDKMKLRADDEALRAELAGELEKQGYGHAAAEAVARWDPYDHNARAGWFDPEWMFGVSGGFDVAIGNPPYIRGEKITAKPRLRAAYGDFYRATADIYAYFFRKGAELTADRGILCYISSNKFMRTDYGGPLRAFLARCAPPLSILDFGRTGTFDATVRPLVLLARKGGGHAALRAATVRGDAEPTDPGAFMEKHGFSLLVAALSEGGWSLAEPALLRLRDKIAKAGTPLGEYAKKGIYRGVVTGLNKAFVIDEETRARLIGEDPASAELIKPWLRGRDVRRWRADWKGLYLIFARQGTNIRRYPAIERHLSQFRDDLQPKGRRDMRRGRKPGNYQWFEIQDNIAYYEEFSKPKIVYPDIGTEMRAVLDRESRIADATCFIVPGDDAYLLSILNSKVLDFWFRFAMQSLDDPFDGGDMRFKTVNMRHAPIAAADTRTKNRLSALANRIQTARQANPAADIAQPAAEIDETACALYGLDQEEIALIDNLRR